MTFGVVVAAPAKPQAAAKRLFRRRERRERAEMAQGKRPIGRLLALALARCK